MQENLNPYTPPQASALDKAYLPETTQEPQKYSGLGISSFVLSLTGGVAIFVLFVVAGILESSIPSGADKSSAHAVIGLFAILLIGLILIALGLGIGGLFQKNRKKIFAILGTIFSSVMLLMTVGLIGIGLTMG